MYLSFVLAGTHVSIVHKVLVTDTLLIHIRVMILILITCHFNLRDLQVFIRGYNFLVQTVQTSPNHIQPTQMQYFKSNFSSTSMDTNGSTFQSITARTCKRLSKVFIYRNANLVWKLYVLIGSYLQLWPNLIVDKCVRFIVSIIHQPHRFVSCLFDPLHNVWPSSANPASKVATKQ